MEWVQVKKSRIEKEQMNVLSDYLAFPTPIPIFKCRKNTNPNPTPIKIDFPVKVRTADGYHGFGPIAKTTFDFSM